MIDSAATDCSKLRREIPSLEQGIPIATGRQREGATVELNFEGIAVPAREGETIAAALTEAGLRALRDTRNGEPRGVFCGMGVCHDCVVEVDGLGAVRACMTKVTGPHQIRRRVALPDIAATRDHPTGAFWPLPIRTPDVAVIGGGAAGLTAAAVAAESGAAVLLIDERPAPGGQYFKQPVGPAVAGADRQARAGAALLERVRRSGAAMLEGASVWGAFPPLELAVTDQAGGCVVRPSRLIVATGAYERALPVPGWTLPGVMTTGAAQTLLRSYGVKAGQRVLVAGNGPLNIQVAVELARAGAAILGVAELAPRAIAPVWRMLGSDPGLVARGIRYLGSLRRRGIPVWHGRCVTRIEQDGAALRATIARWDGKRFGDERHIVVDAVAMGYGFQPSGDLLRELGALQDFDAPRNQLVTRRDADCLTSVENLYAIGDCCGLGGAQAAQSEGVIAGLAAVASIGRAIPSALLREGVSARSRLRRQRRFQKALWQVYAAPDPRETVVTPDTIICRCEGVTAAALQAALADGSDAIGAMKRATRAGMGHCQGRYCALALAAMIAQRTGKPIDEDRLFAPRPPIRPIRIGDMLGHV